MESFSIQKLQELLSSSKSMSFRSDTLNPLFENEQEYNAWKLNRNVKQILQDKSEIFPGSDFYLGIDSGSTTTKILILDENEHVVFNYYEANQGNSLQKVSEGLSKFWQQCKVDGIEPNIKASCSTGYGEELIKQAFNLDVGIVETMAHLQGARWVNPNVSFILDIGGQDMKSIFVKDGAISNIELNEACSSGCGSFLQNFASIMSLTLNEFSQKACLAKNPADLGTRCTVFMNSKVKQSLRENAPIDDIAAGLAYSVMKNCLFKVLKINNINVLGDNIVVQGGTFRNDAVYRALEVLSGKQVFTTDIPELMGALGAALYAKNNKIPSSKNNEIVLLPSYETKELHCKGCTNQCSVLKFSFKNGNTCYSGNKCENVYYPKNSDLVKGINFFEEKDKILFGTDKKYMLAPNAAKPVNNNTRKIIGIPRILNIYENYPFWKTLFENCGLEVIVSPESTMKLYKNGVSSVMSDNICFPAKLAHGHILALVEADVSRIFYPIVPKDDKEFVNSNNSYNCPVVSGYPEVIRSSIDTESNYNIPFDKPVMNLSNEKVLKKQCFNYLSSIIHINRSVFDKAFEKAIFIRKRYNTQFIENQRKILNQSVASGELTFIVAGRPYHADLLVNQKIGQILSDLGVHVLTDDVFRDTISVRGDDWNKLNFVSQWSYPNRVMQAAFQVAKLPRNIQLLQLNSFGCGPDSFLMEEAGAILQKAGKNHTIIRIDEISSSGSIRLRLRSLIESLHNN